MKNKILVSAVLLGLSSAAAHAATLNLRQEFTPRYDGQPASHKERVAVSHRFKNGVGFEVEAKWKSKNEDAYGEQVSGGHQANVSYVYKLNERWSLKPQYKWESDSSAVNHQFNLTAGYKINSDWDVSFRHRYNYKNVANGANSHYNRWTFAAGYAGVENWKFGTTVDYTFNEKSSGPRWKDKQSWFSEVNFTGEYKGLESGWRPFGELGFVPYNSGTEIDAWRPRVRVGVKYNF